MTPRPAPDALRSLLLEGARVEGFELAGIARIDPDDPGLTRHRRFLGAWVARGMHGEMAWLARPESLERREDPSSSLEGVRAALVVGHLYGQDDPDGVPDDPARGVIARYARGRDYHRIVQRKLEGVRRRVVEGAGREVPMRAYVDTGPVLERELARRAGLGWFGRNTMLIDPRRGSWFFLGVLLVGAEVEADAPFEADRCGSCRACLDACPTGALLGRDEHGAPVMDARLCISYLTIEHRGPIPRELRPAIGNRIYGCDICQEVCPFNVGFGEGARDPGYAARGPGERPAGVEALPGEADSEATHPGTDGPPLAELLEMALSEAGWEAFSRGSAIRRAGRGGFARNVCVAIGNWLATVDEPAWGATEDAAVALLVRALADPEPLVRGHAVWALGRVGSPEARKALVGVGTRDDDPFVLNELGAVASG